MGKSWQIQTSSTSVPSTPITNWLCAWPPTETVQTMLISTLLLQQPKIFGTQPAELNLSPQERSATQDSSRICVTRTCGKAGTSTPETWTLITTTTVSSLLRKMPNSIWT